MIAIARPQVGYLYYAGLLLAIPWTCTVLPLRFWHTTAACMAVPSGYEIVAWLKPTLPEILTNNFFFLSAVIIAMVADIPADRERRVGPDARLGRVQRRSQTVTDAAWLSDSLPNGHGDPPPGQSRR
jgi:hypothetical protein